MSAGASPEPSLSEELLGPSTDPEADQPTAVQPIVSDGGPAAEDDELDLTSRRLGPVTTALVAALLVGLGALVGSALTRAVAPEPAPEVVYVLDGSTATPAGPR